MLKKFIVEPYDPLYLSIGNDEILTKELKLSGAFAFGSIASGLFLALSIIFSPWWVIGIMGLVVFVGFLCEQPLVRKRIPASDSRSSTCRGGQVYGWYSDKLVASHDTYRQQLVDYFDHIRAGGDTIYEVECQLREWVKLEAEYEVKRKENAKEEALKSLDRSHQLEEYKKMIGYVEKKDFMGYKTGAFRDKDVEVINELIEVMK